MENRWRSMGPQPGKPGGAWSLPKRRPLVRGKVPLATWGKSKKEEKQKKHPIDTHQKRNSCSVHVPKKRGLLFAQILTWPSVTMAFSDDGGKLFDVWQWVFIAISSLQHEMELPLFGAIYSRWKLSYGLGKCMCEWICELKYGELIQHFFRWRAVREGSTYPHLLWVTLITVRRKTLFPFHFMSFKHISQFIIKLCVSPSHE